MAKKGGGYRSAGSGRYVTSKYGKANPGKVVKEAPGRNQGAGGKYRSAGTGRYVTSKLGKANPGTTARED